MRVMVWRLAWSAPRDVGQGRLSRVEPGHHAAEFAADGLDGVGGHLLAGRHPVGATGSVLVHPPTSEVAGLDVREALLHAALDVVRVDDLRPVLQRAPLGGVADAEEGVGPAPFVEEVDDELQLVHDLEVGHLGRVARLDEHLVAGDDQLVQRSDEHGLLSEEVGHGLGLERGVDDAGSGATDVVRVGESQLMGQARRVLLDGQEHRHAATVDEALSDEVAWALGCDHEAVDAIWDVDQAVVDREAVCERDGVAGLQLRRHVVREDRRLLRVGSQDHHDVGPGGGLVDRHDAEASLGGLRSAARAFSQTDADTDRSVGQVQRVCMALGAVADDGDVLVTDHLRICIGNVERTGGQCGFAHSEPPCKCERTPGGVHLGFSTTGAVNPANNTTFNSGKQA